MELDQDALNRWIEEKWRHGPCPVCDTNEWVPLPRIGMVPNINPPGPNGGNVVPVLLIHCTNCGYMLTVNAVTAGVLQTADWDAELAKFSGEESRQVSEAGR